MLAHGVEERERAAAGADHEPEVAVEADDVAGDAAVVRGVDLRARDLEVRRRPRLARLLGPDAELVEQLLVEVAGLGLHVDVAVEHGEAAVLEPDERVDLGQREVVAQEDLDQRVDDRRQAVQVAARDAGGRDALLRDARRDREERREVGLRDVLGVLLGDLLDVDAAHVAEDQHRQLAPAVPGDADVVLLGDGALLLDENRVGLLAVHHDRQDLVVQPGGLVGGVGELHGAGLHAAAGEDLALQDDRPADLAGDLRAPRRRMRARPLLPRGRPWRANSALDSCS